MQDFYDTSPASWWFSAIALARSRWAAVRQCPLWFAGESWRFGTGGFSGRRPSEAPAWPSGEPPAVALQPRGAIQAEEDDDLIGQHRDLDLAAQPAERERNRGLSQFGGAADVASAFVVRHRDGQAVFRSHDPTTLRPAPGL